LAQLVVIAGSKNSTKTSEKGRRLG